eukprot:64047_1
MTQLISTMPCNGVKTVHTNGDIWHDPAGVCVSYHQDETSPTSEILLCQDGVMMHKSFTTSHCMGSPDEVLAYCEEMIEPENDIESCESNCAASGCTYLHVTYYSKTTGCNSWDGSGTPSALSTSTEFETVSGNDYPTIILNWCLSNSTMISNGTAILNLTYATADCSGDPVQSDVERLLGPRCKSNYLFGSFYSVSAVKYEVVTAENTYDTTSVPTGHPIAPASIPEYTPTAPPSAIASTPTDINQLQGNHVDDTTLLIAVICLGFIAFIVVYVYNTYIRRKRMKATDEDVIEEPGAPRVNSNDAKEELLSILSEWGLSQYYTIVVESQGYDRVEDWMDITVEQLEKDMTFKPGHAQRFVKKTKQYFEAMDIDDVKVEVIQKQNTDGLNAKVEVQAVIAVARRYSSDHEDEGAEALYARQQTEELFDTQKKTKDGEITTGGNTTDSKINVSLLMQGSVSKTQQ